MFYGTADTPTLVFDGDVRTELTGYAGIFNQYVVKPMPLYVVIYVTKTGNDFTLTATVTRDGDMPTDNLKIYCAVTETFNYDGRTLYNVLRDMYPGGGKPFTINDGETKDVVFNGTLAGSWNVNNLEWVVWAQRTVPGTPNNQPVYGTNKAAGTAVGVAPASLGSIKATFN